jgi:hypothetical protein
MRLRWRRYLQREDGNGAEGGSVRVSFAWEMVDVAGRGRCSAWAGCHVSPTRLYAGRAATVVQRSAKPWQQENNPPLPRVRPLVGLMADRPIAAVQPVVTPHTDPYAPILFHTTVCLSDPFISDAGGWYMGLAPDIRTRLSGPRAALEPCFPAPCKAAEVSPAHYL